MGSAGPGLLWRIYGAIKHSTRQVCFEESSFLDFLFVYFFCQEAAVFVLEKRALDKYAKKDRDLILDAMRKGKHRFFSFDHHDLFSF